jgi:hypothetical protein
MRKWILAGAALLVALAVAPAAGARQWADAPVANVAVATHAGTLCGHPDLYVTVYAVGVSCGTARTVERYWTHHAILLHPVARIAGRRWVATLNRHTGITLRAGRQKVPLYRTLFTSGSRWVEIDSPPYS